MARITSAFFLDSNDRPVTESIEIVRKWEEFNYAFVALKSPSDGKIYEFCLLGEREESNIQFVFLSLPPRFGDGRSDDLIVYKYLDEAKLVSLSKEELACASRLWND
ncbi:MAG: hypothetical protein Q8T09_11080 [Candidatus Melainabacteria bacterium]|nr:hypothetical protein [Candidatus Melainabacteria bacterium]